MIRNILAVVAVFIGGTAHIASAQEIRQISLTSFSDVSVIGVEKGCTKTVSGTFGIKSKKSITCYAVDLRNVTGTNQLGNTESVGEVLLYPAGESREDADTIASLLVAKLKNNTAEGATVEFSTLRFINRTVALGDLTKDPSAKQPVKLGGISAKITVVTKDGNFTRTQSDTISVGVK